VEYVGIYPFGDNGTGHKIPVTPPRAVTWLHAVVEDTVSVFKQFEVKDGKFVKKAGS
jgi:hypothetical protein